MSSPLSKKKRTEAAASTLLKPFKSPMLAKKTFVGNEEKGKDEGAMDMGDPTQFWTDRLKEHYDKPLELDPDLTESLLEPSGKFRPPRSEMSGQEIEQSLKVGRARRTSVLQGLVDEEDRKDRKAHPALYRKRVVPSRGKNYLEDSSSAPLGKEKMSIDRKMGGTRKRSNQLQRSGNINHGSDDDSTSTLSNDWRSASQSAADTIYEPIAHRVARMGGPAAFARFRREQARSEHSHFETRDPQMGESSAAADNEYDMDSEIDRPDSDDDEVFNMGTMLTHLNIDHGLIGYDAELEGWADSA
ncbi:MAG: hypothetical protein M1814_001832 [Vezdaea aestivalis]|nr:MAG: hypothetical protein M1814_001832 [Vezdaea aestivalis]